MSEAATPYDEVWCVMDSEKASDRPSCEQALKMLRENGIKPCLSNPSFEVWLLSHFQKTTNSYFDSDAVVHSLDGCWNSTFERNYEKEDPAIFQQLLSLRATAIENARWAREVYHSNRPILDCNAATDVYRFVERLLGPPA
jgi:hypothetical protein